MILPVVVAFAAIGLIFVLAFRRPRRPGQDAFDLIRQMSDADQRHVQDVVTARGKIEAIKAMRTRSNSSLRTAKEAVELLDSVNPATLKFDG